jgi:hypothetical protein
MEKNSERFAKVIGDRPFYPIDSDGTQVKGKDMMKLSLPPKLAEKLVIFFCKIFIPSYVFDALLC